jgi:hypothetical protein
MGRVNELRTHIGIGTANGGTSEKVKNSHVGSNESSLEADGYLTVEGSRNEIFGIRRP